MVPFLSKSIISRLNGVFLPVISIGIIIVAGTIIFLDYYRSTKDLDEKITNTLELAKISLFEPIWYMNQLAIDNLSDAIMLDNDIVAIRISDEVGVNLNKSIRKEFQSFTFIELSTNANLFHKTIQVVRNKKLVGQIDFVFTNQRVIDRVKQYSISILLLIFIVIVIVGSIVYLVGYHFLRKPIDSLKETAIDLAQGNLDREIDTSRIDELGVLARSFSVMRDSIRDKMSEMRYFNEHLEDLVNQRTGELSNALEDIKKAKKNADAANEAKSEFLSNVSHELRTPMHGILGFANLCFSRIDQLSKEKLKEYLQEILQSGERLLNLLNVLLDLSKLESGKEDYQFNDESISKTVISVINELNALLNNQKISILFNPPQFDDCVPMDQERIMQVVRNLISNAIKFSEPGNQIEIDIILLKKEIKLSVKDSGIGVPEDEVETIFDKFIQSSRTNTGAGGTGLGLSICKHIIDIHQGAIWAENNQKGGATFHFQLPRITVKDI